MTRISIRLLFYSLCLLLLCFSSASAAERWEYFVPGNDIQDVAFQGEYVWCSTIYSIVRWDRRDDSYTQYTTRDYGINRWPGTITTDDRGGVWAGSGRGVGVMRYDGVSWTEPEAKDLPAGVAGLSPFFTERSGTVWFSGGATGPVRLKGSSWTVYALRDSLRGVNEMISDPEGILWFAASTGAWSFDGSHWRRFTPADGLADSTVLCAAVDRFGAKWFGASKGVSRFDGTSWRTFTKADGLPGNQVNAVAGDDSGRVWFGTSGGVSRWDGSSMTTFRETDGLLASRITGITTDRAGKVWLCHGSGTKGLSVFDGGKWNRITSSNSGLPDEAAYSAACGPDGVLWFVLEWSVASFDGSVWRRYTMRDGLKSNKVRRIFIDGSNRKWFEYGNDAGLSRFDGAEWKTYTTADGLVSNFVRLVTQGKDGAMYACTSTGVCRLNGETWEYIPDRERLRSVNFYDAAEEPGGTLWFATGGGLSRFDGSGWRTWTTAEGLPDDWVQGVSIAPDARVWFTAGEKLCCLAGDSLTVHPSPSDESTGKPLPLGPLAVDGEGTVWACAGERIGIGNNVYRTSGLWMYRNGEWDRFSLPFPDDTSLLTSFQTHLLNGVHADDRGEIWITFRSGLGHITGGKCAILETNTPGTVWCEDIAVDHNNTIWFGSAALSAPTWSARYDNGRWTNCNGIDEHMLDARRIGVDSRNRKWFYTEEGMIRYNGTTWEIVDGLVHGDTGTFIIGPDDALWFGSTDEGLWKWNGETWTNYTVADGLPSNAIIPRAFGPDGALWCSTGDDIAWYDGRSWNVHHMEKKWESLTIDSDGVVWVATMDGVLCFDGTEWTEITLGTDYERTWFRQVVMDENHVLWAATWNGVLRFDGREWKHYGESEGLLNESVNLIAVDHLNRKWISTQRGICMLDDSAPQSVSESATTPFTLLGNYPNPFNASTLIAFTLPSPGAACLVIYDITGRKVRDLAPGKLPAGRNAARWDGRDDAGREVSSGVYITRLTFGKHTHAGRMALVK